MAQKIPIVNNTIVSESKKKLNSANQRQFTTQLTTNPVRRLWMANRNGMMF